MTEPNNQDMPAHYSALLTRLQQATAPSRELDRLIMCGIGGWHRITPSQARNKHGAFIAPEDWIGRHGDGSPILDGLHGTTMHREVPNVTGSLDACKSLLKRLSPGCGYQLTEWPDGRVHAVVWKTGAPSDHTGKGKRPEFATLAAVFTMLQSEEKASET